MGKKSKAVITINSSISAAVAAAIIPIPVADAVAIGGIQVTMLSTLGGIYDRIFSRQMLTGLLGAVATNSVGVYLASLAKSIPIIGTIPGSIAQMAIAGSLTAVLGYAFLELLEKGKTINASNLKAAMKNNKDKGEEVKKEVKKHGKAIKKVNLKSTSKSFKTQITLTFNARHLENPSLSIMSLIGDFSKDYAITSSSTKKTINITSFEKGIYFAAIKSDNVPDVTYQFEKI